MAVKIKFDTTHNAEQPTFVLASRNGNLLGKIPVTNVQFKDCLNSYADLSFEVNKADCINEKDKNELIKIVPINVHGLVGSTTGKTRIGQISSNQLSEFTQYMQMTEKLINSKVRLVTETKIFEFTELIFGIEDNALPNEPRKVNIYSNKDSGLNIEVDREGNVYLYSVGQWNLDLEQSCRIELSFEVPSGAIRNIFWEQIKDFKLAWAREWNKLFELKVDLSEEKSVRKIVSAKSLGEAELSQINLYNIEINTETDIEREDYKPTILFNETDKSASLLSRIMEKAPHYHIRHVDSSIAKIQRTFTFDNTSIYDAFQEISEEINCLFQIECYLDNDGNIVREINVFDLEAYCYDCGHRGEFIDECDECHSTNIKTGYGEDTTIFITTENLADSVSYTTDVDSVKNCFKLEAGDDLMTATVANCNPNGSSYIWYISDELKEDMSVELVNKLAQYDDEYAYYQDEYTLDFTKYEKGTQIVTSYNALIDKYKVFTEAYHKIDKPIVGYADLMKKYYDTIDFYLYLNNTLMPSVEISRTTAALEGAKINTFNLSPVAVQNLRSCSLSTANSAVLAMAKTLIDSTRYRVKINESTYKDGEWKGTFIITNYSDEEDTAETNSIFVNITGDYERFVKQKIEKILHKQSDEVTDIVGLFQLEDNLFKEELKKYCLISLNNFYDCCQSCLDILIEQGIADKKTWANKNPDLYTDLYIPYYNKLLFIQNEIKTREGEIEIIAGVYDKDGDLFIHGIQTILEYERNFIQDELNFEKFLGNDLWLEFVSYRREDTYENSNYISDGLDNAELFENALKFIEVARKDIFKSATLQHSISSELKNLLVIKDFEPLLDYFEVGNWLKIRVDDKIYQLRLVDYQIDFNSLDRLSVTFSDVRKFGFSRSLTVREKIQKAASMATSYGSVTRQAEKGKKSNDKLNDWVNKGLALTKMKIIDSADNQNITWDSHGLLCKEYLPITDTYDDKQLKIINKGLFLTDDNWITSKAGIGNFNFYNPETGQIEESYGVIADTLVGNLILSEKVGIYNTKNSITLDENGFKVKGNNNTVLINPNPTMGKYKDSIFTIVKNALNDSDEKILISFDNNGYGMIGGWSITDSSISKYGILNGKKYNILLNSIPYTEGESNPYNPMFGVIFDNDWKFYVRSNGELFAKNAEIIGSITSQTDSDKISLSDSTIALYQRDDITREFVEYGTLTTGNFFNRTGVFLSSSNPNGYLAFGYTEQGNYKYNRMNLIIHDGTLETDNITFDKNNVAFLNGFEASGECYIYNILDVGGIISNGAISANVGRDNIGFQTDGQIVCEGTTATPGLYCRGSMAAEGSLHIGDGIFSPVSSYFGQLFVDGWLWLTSSAAYGGNTGNLYRKTDGKIVLTSSSKRYKENITEKLDDFLNPEKLYDLPVVQFNYNEENKDCDIIGGTQIGLIAEDVAKIYPNACVYNNDGQPENWYERTMIPAILKLVQNQKRQIDILEEKMKILEGKLKNS